MEIKNFIKRHIAIFTVSLIAIIVLSVIIKYNVEGETNLPFEISKIMIISTAGGKEREDTEYNWNLDVLQINDIYIDIIKNKNYHEKEIIDKVIINNFKIESYPLKGQINLYRPTNQNDIFNNEEQYKIEKEIEFIGNEISELENLKIANQGGLIFLRVVNTGIGTYTSDETEEVNHDGTLLSKIGISNEDIKFSISFDISIELKSNKQYKATITLQMPNGNLIEEGTTNYQLNKNEIVFKRY